jgi:hypothetical protein
MIKRINVNLDEYWRMKLNKKTPYSSISLDVILCDAAEKLEKKDIKEIVRQIVKEKPLAHILVEGRGLSHYVAAVLIERLAAKAGIHIDLYAGSTTYQNYLEREKKEALKKLQEGQK